MARSREAEWPLTGAGLSTGHLVDDENDENDDDDDDDDDDYSHSVRQGYQPGLILLSISS